MTSTGGAVSESSPVSIRAYVSAKTGFQHKGELVEGGLVLAVVLMALGPGLGGLFGRVLDSFIGSYN